MCMSKGNLCTQFLRFLSNESVTYVMYLLQRLYNNFETGEKQYFLCDSNLEYRRKTELVRSESGGSENKNRE